MKGDKKKLIHGMFLVLGGFMLMRLLFGGRKHHPYYPPDQGYPYA